MKVLFLANIPSPYRIDFFNGLGSLCELTVLFERKVAKDRNEKWKNNHFLTFKSHFLIGFPIGNDSAVSLEMLYFLSIKKFDIIVVGNYSTPTGILSILYMKMMKIPFIISADGGIIKSDSKLIFKYKRLLISSAKAWLSSSNETTRYFEHYGARKNGIYIYPFTSISEKDVIDLPLSKNQKSIIRKDLEIIEEKIILSIGRMIEVKGFDTLIKSVARIDKSIGVYIVGGKPLDEYIRLMKEYNIQNIHFVDFQTQNDLLSYYKMSDLFVLPTRGDVWGLVINEAMANGLPVITTDKCIAGIELIEDDVNGYIIPVDNEELLAEKIINLINDDEKMLKMSTNNLLKIKKYTIENMTNKHFDIFKNLIEKGDIFV